MHVPFSLLITQMKSTDWLPLVETQRQNRDKGKQRTFKARTLLLRGLKRRERRRPNPASCFVCVCARRSMRVQVAACAFSPPPPLSACVTQQSLQYVATI